jgi:glycosyltransferase involved in cell wall biosynthesis
MQSSEFTKQASSATTKNVRIDRIFYLSRAVFPSKTANSVNIMKMCSAMSVNGFRVKLFGLRANSDSLGYRDIHNFYNTKTGFRMLLIRQPKHGSRLLLYVRLIIALIVSRRKNTLVYSRERLMVCFALCLGYKTILEAHDFFSSKFNRRIERFLFGHSRFIKLVVISQALRSDYLEFYKKIPLIEVHHDASEVVDIVPSDLNHLRGRANALQIGYFGHLYQGRGIELIIRLAYELPECDFHVFGGLPEDVSKYTKQLLSTNIKLYGFKQQSELPYLRSECDVLLMPYQTNLSIYGSNLNTVNWMSPMKLFEYMSSSRAIISSDLPVIREVLNDKNSILVAPEDLDGWVAAVRSLENVELREEIAKNAHIEFLLKYTWDIRVKNIFNEYGV